MSEPAYEPAVEPAADPALDGSAAPEPGWAPSREEWDQFTGAVQSLAQLEQQRASVYQPQQQTDGTPRPDPWERPDTFQQDLDAYINARMAPVQQFQTDAQLAEAEERAMDILADHATREGEFDTKLARIRADSLLPTMQQRYGPGPKAAEAALEAAAREQREYEQAIYQAAVSRYTNQIATLSGAPGEPGSTYTVGVQSRTMPDYTKGGSVTSRFFGPNRET